MTSEVHLADLIDKWLKTDRMGKHFEVNKFPTISVITLLKPNGLPPNGFNSGLPVMWIADDYVDSLNLSPIEATNPNFFDILRNELVEIFNTV